MTSFQRVALCPNDGLPTTEMRDDWNVLHYDECPACHWNNRPSFEEWKSALRRAYDGGDFDADPDNKFYVAMILREEDIY